MKNHLFTAFNPISLKIIPKRRWFETLFLDLTTSSKLSLRFQNKITSTFFLLKSWICQFFFSKRSSYSISKSIMPLDRVIRFIWPEKIQYFWRPILILGWFLNDLACYLRIIMSVCERKMKWLEKIHFKEDVLRGFLRFLLYYKSNCRFSN